MGKKAIIVLGYKSGEKINEILRGRLETASAFAKKNKIKKIILSGGIGSGNISEAELMKKYLSSKIKPSFLIAEKKSLDTLQNAIFSKGIIDKLKIKKIFVITSYWHMLRARLIFKKIFKNYKLNFIPSFENQNFFDKIFLSLKEKILLIKLFWWYR